MTRPQPKAAGRILGLAIHGLEGKPMIEITEARVVPLAGLDGDRGGKGKRGVTLLSREQWADVQAELRAALPWHTRRANVLVEGLRLQDAIGCRMRIGEAELFIHDETRPCGLMDKLHPGLRTTLTTDGRGGVHGAVHIGGLVRVGDPVYVLDAHD